MEKLKNHLEIWEYLDKNNYSVFCKQVGNMWIGALFRNDEFVRYGKEKYPTARQAIYETEKIIYKHLKNK